MITINLFTGQVLLIEKNPQREYFGTLSNKIKSSYGYLCIKHQIHYEISVIMCIKYAYPIMHAKSYCKTTPKYNFLTKQMCGY